MELRESVCNLVDFFIVVYKYPVDEKKKEKLVLAWHMGLEDISDDRIAKAIKKVIKENKYMPTPADFISSCGKTLTELAKLAR